MRLKGKVAIITGAGSGIGAATAIIFAKEGAKVVVADVNEQGGKDIVAKIKKAKGEAFFLRCDVSREADAKNLINETIRKYKRLDILFNNAGIVKWGAAAEAKEQDWDKVIDVNLKGVFLCSKYAIPVMKGGGSIINTASIAGLVAFGGIAAYCASKGGIVMLTKSMALDYAAKKIRVNAICPGVIETAMTKSILEDKKMKENMLKSTPIGRIGKPEDIGYAALYLASDESTFVTGTALVVDGGWTVQ